MGVAIDRERRLEPREALDLFRPDQRAQPVAVIRVGQIDGIALETDAARDRRRRAERRQPVAPQLDIERQTANRERR